MTTIKAKGFILRHVKLSDAQVFFDAEQDEDAKRNFMRTPSSVSDVEENIKEDLEEYKKGRPSSEKFAIEVDGKCAGYIALNQLNVQHFEHKAKVDFCLHPDLRGKGIVTEAVKAIVPYAFKKYSLKRLESWCRTFNKATARVLEKNGFELEGVLKKNKCKDGEYLDDMLWAIVK